MAIDEDSKVFDRDGKFFRDQLKAEIMRQQVRRDAKVVMDEEERASATGGIDTIAKLVYDPLPAASPELIPGLLPESGTAAIVGETNVGKTTLAIEIGSSLLTGAPLWGAIEPSHTINKVVYILGEHTCSTLQGLFHRTKLPHEGNFMLIGPEHLHPHKALVVGGIQQNVAIERLMRWTEGAGLIVFDPLAGFVQGASAENDNSSMRNLIDAMSLIATTNGACCLILSHMGKPLLSPEGGEVRRTTYATRGATAVEDALTHIYYLRKPLSVKQQKGDGQEHFELSIRKYKGITQNQVYKLSRDPDTKRNTLFMAKEHSTIYPTVDDRREFERRVQRYREANPDFNMGTCIKMVADGEGVSQETMERWLSQV